jgi:hypothetical protein
VAWKIVPTLLPSLNWGNTLSDREALNSYLEDLDSNAAGKVELAANRIKHRKYFIKLYYVTTGRCSPALASEADRIARQSAAPAGIDIIEGKRVLRLLSDYLDGVAPPIPLLELQIESGQAVRLDGILQRFDGATGIESWVFPVSVRNIAAMYESAGIRLFARNVRGFLGETAINRNMEKTLETEPAFFWYYNNGITIICDSAERTSRGGRNVIRVINPQVINGQQTTRTLHKKASRNDKATVLVRVISVPRDTAEGERRFETLVSKIVAATNWQNAIKASDLMSNDRRQIEIERNLRKLDYHYLRKRQSKGEARRQAGVRHAVFIKKEELAQAVAACDMDPSIVREGKEQLFEERFYSQVFPNSDPWYFLPRYRLATSYVSRAARGYPERAYAKWVVTHFVWRRLAKILRTRHLKETFNYGDFASLQKACEAAYKAALAFYRDNRGGGETALDVSTFFQRRNLHSEFETFWRKAPAIHRNLFAAAMKRFEKELKAAAAE